MVHYALVVILKIYNIRKFIYIYKNTLPMKYTSNEVHCKLTGNCSERHLSRIEIPVLLKPHSEEM